VTDSVQPELFSLSDDSVLVVDARSVPNADETVSGDAEAAEAPGVSKAWWHRLAVFDLETTGIDVETHRDRERQRDR
jgi:DNA polymerase-3 subunit epsilon